MPVKIPKSIFKSYKSKVLFYFCKFEGKLNNFKSVDFKIQKRLIIDYINNFRYII